MSAGGHTQNLRDLTVRDGMVEHLAVVRSIDGQRFVGCVRRVGRDMSLYLMNVARLVHLGSKQSRRAAGR